MNGSFGNKPNIGVSVSESYGIELNKIVYKTCSIKTLINEKHDKMPQRCEMSKLNQCAFGCLPFGNLAKPIIVYVICFRLVKMFVPRRNGHDWGISLNGRMNK